MLSIYALLLFCTAQPIRASPLRVFIMAGQSNMQGQCPYAAKNTKTGAYLNGTLEYLTTDPRTHEEFAKLKLDGRWMNRSDVWIYTVDGDRSGQLSVGYGASESCIGPELGFGWTVGDALKEQVLLLKVSWGGKSLAIDFRPPSSGGTVGPYYTSMVSIVRNVTGRLSSLFPSYTGQFELAGFAWHQGWNDADSDAHAAEYASNLQNLIADVRKEFRDLPGGTTGMLPVSVGAQCTCGCNGTSGLCSSGFCLQLSQQIMPAQIAVDSVANRVAAQETCEFHRHGKYSPGHQLYHWNNNCESYWLVGKAMGLGMLSVLDTPALTHTYYQV